MTRLFHLREGVRRLLVACQLAVLLACLVVLPTASLAAPVDWREVAATEQGHQWWDAGSLRYDRRGRLSVLSRFQPAGQQRSSLYVMELDCDQQRFRDVSVNGLPRFAAPWLTTSDDPLGREVVRSACAAAQGLKAYRSAAERSGAGRVAVAEGGTSGIVDGRS